MRAFLLHWPHFLPILLALAAAVYLWRADRRHRRAELPQGTEPGARPGLLAGAPPGPIAPARSGSPRTRSGLLTPRSVNREAARRGALVLGPLLGAMASGVAIYGIDLDGRHPGRGLAFTHAGLGALLCLLAAYKLAGTDLAGLRRRDRRTERALAAGGSLLLAILLVPILLTGIVVLIRPSEASFAANLHLVASAWWTLLATWHLVRHLAASLRTLRSPRAGQAFTVSSHR